MPREIAIPRKRASGLAPAFNSAATFLLSPLRAASYSSPCDEVDWALAHRLSVKDEKGGPLNNAATAASESAETSCPLTAENMSPTTTALLWAAAPFGTRLAISNGPDDAPLGRRKRSPTLPSPSRLIETVDISDLHHPDQGRRVDAKNLKKNGNEFVTLLSKEPRT